MVKAIACAALALFSLSGFAGSLSPNDAKTMVSAFKSIGYPGKIEDKTIIYPFNVTCTYSENYAVESSKAPYALPEYFCDLGIGKLFYAKAQVLFEATAAVFGTSKEKDVLTAKVEGLNCQIHLDIENVAKRFTCVYK